jgi:hypothetical protein
VADGVLEARPAETRPNLPHEGLDVSVLHGAQASRVVIEANQGQQLRGRGAVGSLRRFGEAANAVEVATVRSDKVLPWRQPRSRQAALRRQAACKRAHYGGEVDVVLRILGRETQQIRSGELLDPACAALPQQIVHAWQFSDAEPDGQTRVTLGAEPHDESLGVGPQQRQRGEAGVVPWIELFEHRNPRLWAPQAARLRCYRTELCEVSPALNRAATRIRQADST